jgi:8-oxo-dGTP pyrophosphatase MutT (NUDIX family)
MPGRNHYQALKRRLSEELGIDLNKLQTVEEFMIFDYQIPCESGFL